MSYNKSGYSTKILQLSRTFKQKLYIYILTEKQKENIFFQKLAELCYKIYLEPHGY